MPTIEHCEEKSGGGAEDAAASLSHPPPANASPRTDSSDPLAVAQGEGAITTPTETSCILTALPIERASPRASTLISVACSMSDDSASSAGRHGAYVAPIRTTPENHSEPSSRELGTPVVDLDVAEVGYSAEKLASSDMPVPLKRGRSSDLSHTPSPNAACAHPVHAEPDRHCRQRYLMEAIMRIPPPKFVTQHDFTRILGDGAPRAKYIDLPHHMRTTNHWGQRKLFLSEVEFLTIFVRNVRARSPPPKRIIVVYAGAAPGNHIPYLFDLFDNNSGDLQFALYDPADWNIKPRHNQRFDFEEITLNPPESSCCNGFFTDDVARYYKSLCEVHGYVTLFISDIRTGDPKCMNAPQLEAAVKRDMEWQQTWIRIMRPVGSMLKFRLPWATGSTLYVKGDIYLPVWGPQTTTETRLIVYEKDLDTSIDYDHRSYEERMFFFNTCSRVDFYQHDVHNVAGIDRCYDCAAEVHILRQYFATVSGPGASHTDFSQRISRMMHEISKHISSGRTLASVIDVHTRKEWFEPRQYDTETFQLSKAAKSDWFVEKYGRPMSASSSLSVKDVSHLGRGTPPPSDHHGYVNRADQRDLRCCEADRSDPCHAGVQSGGRTATIGPPSSCCCCNPSGCGDSTGHVLKGGRGDRGQEWHRRGSDQGAREGLASFDHRNRDVAGYERDRRGAGSGGNRLEYTGYRRERWHPPCRDSPSDSTSRSCDGRGGSFCDRPLPSNDVRRIRPQNDDGGHP